MRRALARARRRRSRSEAARGRRTLMALASSALALPGLARTAAADTRVERWTADYGFSLYREDDIPGSKTSTGQDSERYTIETHQFYLEGPLGDRADVGLDVIYETMSGATPWFVEQGPDGDPVQVMTGATVEEERTDLLLRSNVHYDNGRLGIQAGTSFENDYLSLNAGLSGERQYNDENTTLGLQVGYSWDRITPTDEDLYPSRPDQETKHSVGLAGSLTQILTRSTVARTSLAWQYQTGFLSDPYKLVSVGGANIGDRRPDERHQLAWLTQLRQHVGFANASAHLDYRFAWDDWGIRSHTVELAWHQTLFVDWLRVVPAGRYTTQSAASFYGPFFDALPSDGYASSDYRLSPYGAVSGRVRAEADVRGWPFGWDWQAVVGYERYLSSGDLALGSVAVESPGLVDFQLFTVGIRGRF